MGILGKFWVKYIKKLKKIFKIFFIFKLIKSVSINIENKISKNKRCYKRHFYELETLKEVSFL